MRSWMQPEGMNLLEGNPGITNVISIHPVSTVPPLSGPNVMATVPVAVEPGPKWWTYQHFYPHTQASGGLQRAQIR